MAYVKPDCLQEYQNWIQIVRKSYLINSFTHYKFVYNFNLIRPNTIHTMANTSHGHIFKILEMKYLISDEYRDPTFRQLYHA